MRPVDPTVGNISVIKPTIGGRRLIGEDIVGMLGAGNNVENILEAYDWSRWLDKLKLIDKGHLVMTLVIGHDRGIYLRRVRLRKLARANMNGNPLNTTDAIKPFSSSELPHP